MIISEKKIKHYNKSYLFYIFVLIIILTHQIIFQDFFPNKNLLLGHDYASQIPNFIFGKVWFNNNFLSIPWFTPSFCCGIPFYGDPQSMYYSLQQLIFLFFSPLMSLKLMFLFFSLISFFGTFLLLNKSFNKNIYISLIAASIFLFNGFFNFRAVIGHVTFLSYVFIPIYCYLVILSFEKNYNKPKSIFYLLISSIVFANFIHSGSGTIMLPIIFSILFVILIYIYLNEKLKIIYNLILSFLIGLIISSSKIYASLSFLSNFPREYSPMVFNNFFDLISVTFKSLFLYPNISKFNSSVIDGVINKLNVHEIEFGISIVPLLVFAIFLVNLKKIRFNKFTLIKIISLIFMFTIIIFTAIINISDMALGSFFQKLPIVKNNWVNYRFTLVYIIPVVISSSIFIDKLNFKESNLKIFTLFCLTIIFAQNYFYNKDYYSNQLYDPINFEKFHQEKEKIKSLKIKDMALILDENKKAIINDQRNGLFLNELSPILCYQPIFGYNLESLPRKNLLFNKKDKLNDNLFLYTGNPKFVKEEKLNFFNPSCFIFPKENECLPGDLFNKNQINKLNNFLNYKTFKFKMSANQKFFNYISILSLSLIFTYIIYYIFKKYTSRS